MPALSAILLAAQTAAVTPVRDERSLFHLPGPEEVRVQSVARTDNEQNWPFVPEEGLLMCVWSGGRKVVMFAAKPEGSETEARPDLVFVSTNPFDATLMNMGSTHLIAKTEGVGELIRRFAPFEQLGQRLCNQPQGARIGHGEL